MKNVLCNTCWRTVSIFLLFPNPQSHLPAPGANACVLSQQSRHIFLLIFVFIWEKSCTFATGPPVTCDLFCPLKHLHVPSICSSSRVSVPATNFFLVTLFLQIQFEAVVLTMSALFSTSPPFAQSQQPSLTSIHCESPREFILPYL